MPALTLILLAVCGGVANAQRIGVPVDTAKKTMLPPAAGRAAPPPPVQLLECPATIHAFPGFTQVTAGVGQLNPRMAADYEYVRVGVLGAFMLCSYGANAAVRLPGSADLVSGTAIYFDTQNPLPAGKACKVSTTRPRTVECS
jgi:hypothetical protein